MRPGSRDRALPFVGAGFILGCAICLLTSLVGRSEARRWHAAPGVVEAGALGMVEAGGDVALVGTVSHETPVIDAGLALYERWELDIQYDDGERESRWHHNYDYDRKPPFDLQITDWHVRVESGFVTFHSAREVLLDGAVKLRGFAPGDTVTILGRVKSSASSPVVEAEIICGGARERCLQRISRAPVGPAIGAGLMGLVGGGLVWLGLQRREGEDGAQENAKGGR